MKAIRPPAFAAPHRTLHAHGMRLWAAPLPLFFAVFLIIFFALILILFRSQPLFGAQLPAGWKTQQDPAVFSVAVPPGWTARGDHSTARLELKSSDGATLVIWPVFLGQARLQRYSAPLSPTA